MDNSWITLTTVHDLLGHTKSDERSNLDSKGQSKVSKYANQIEAAKSISERLWSVPDEQEAIKGSVDKQGSFVESHSADATGKADDGRAKQPSSTKKTCICLISHLRKPMPVTGSTD